MLDKNLTAALIVLAATSTILCAKNINNYLDNKEKEIFLLKSVIYFPIYYIIFFYLSYKNIDKEKIDYIDALVVIFINTSIYGSYFIYKRYFLQHDVVKKWDAYKNKWVKEFKFTFFYDKKDKNIHEKFIQEMEFIREKYKIRIFIPLSIFSILFIILSFLGWWRS